MKRKIFWIFFFCLTVPMHAISIKEQIKKGGAAGIQRVQDFASQVARIPQMAQAKVDSMVRNFWGETPYVNKVAKVTSGLGVSKQEKQALVKRGKVNSRAVRKRFGSGAYVPKIALLASGGGFRAMFCTIGFLAGAQRAGLLDMITWMAGVSGGTWGIGTVLTHALAEDKKIRVSDFAEQFAKLVANKSLSPSKNELRSIANILMAQSLGNQFFTSVNLFGALIANRIFSYLPIDARQKQRISDQAPLIESGAWPIPLYTTVQYNPRFNAREYNWVSFDPWQYGGTWLKSYAPIWGTSRRYENGVSVNYHVERSLGFILGICGSAFAAELDQLYEQIQASLPAFMKNIIEQRLLPGYGDKRVVWGRLNNYTKGMAQSPIKKSDYLNLIDAGFTLNLPYPPLSGIRPERTPDIYIMLDSSTTIPDSLERAQNYAKKHNLKFPPIDYRDITTKSISVFMDPKDASVPVVIYIPRISDSSLHEKFSYPALGEYEKWVKGFDLAKCSDKGVCNMMNFSYPFNDSMGVIKTVEFQTIANRSVIFDAIKTVIDKKGKRWWQFWK